MRQIIAAVLPVVCLSLSMTSLHAQSIVAHRGASADAPENTLAAFNLAWVEGADAIEGDFYLTADKQIVCHHDKSLKRTAGVEMDIHTMSLAELKKLDFGSWKDEKFRGESIPTLNEVLATIPTDKQILIEIKCGIEIVQPLAKLLSKSELKNDQVRIICFNANVIKECKQAMPDIKAYWLTGFDDENQKGEFEPAIDDVLRQLKSCQADGLDCNANPQAVDQEFVAQLRSHGYEFHCWTVNDPEQAKHFAQLGVDSITTDKPRLIRQAIEAR